MFNLSSTWKLRNTSHRMSHPEQQARRSEEHTSELQSHVNLVCRLLLEKKKKKKPMRTCHSFSLRSTPTSTARKITPPSTGQRGMGRDRTTSSPRQTPRSMARRHSSAQC